MLMCSIMIRTNDIVAEWFRTHGAKTIARTEYNYEINNHGANNWTIVINTDGIQYIIWDTFISSDDRNTRRGSVFFIELSDPKFFDNLKEWVENV